VCGRYSFTQTPEAIAAAFALAEVPALEPRYNIAPSQSIPVVLLSPETRQRQFRLLQWGLVPSWAKDTKIGAKLINARAETIAEKPSFRAAFKQRRCLVLADGFYEWQRQEGKKQPFYICLTDRAPFAFAGLWEHWSGPNGEALDSCTILTTEPNELLRPIHNRMPVLLEPSNYNLWLDPEVQQVEKLQSLLQAYPAKKMMAYPVSTKVNTPASNSPECIEKL
jgi:putative SOS response-associated peptidase YedK